MTDLLDAGALIGFMQDQPGAGEVETTLRRGESVMNAANLAETVFVLTRRTRLPARELRDRIDRLLGATIQVVAVDAPLAWSAAELRVKHYHRARSALSLADCLLLATAAAGGHVLHTSDRLVLRAARAEGVEVVALPDSRGRRS